MMSETENNKVKEGCPVADQFNAKVYDDIRVVLAEARTKVVVTVNAAMVSAYHEIGRQITEAAGERAGYGQNLLAYLSKRLTAKFGKGFTVANLRNMRQFYQMFPIRYALRSELTWTHCRLLMRIDEPKRRSFYLIIRFDIILIESSKFVNP
ncbi:MAG: hypothetical protein Pg6C_00270 [Treponemataceae bacterium]|nr:MAG: hypothetical protein Pg6C_00270 [Treponemataceae bacterium]